MALYELVKFTVSGTPGTGAITPGAAVSGYFSIADLSLASGTVVSFVIDDGANKEAVRGTWNGTTLSRDTVIRSTNSGNKISASANAIVYLTPLAPDIALLDPTTGKFLQSQFTAGQILQAVSAVTSTQHTNTSTSWADTNLTATITPKFSTSKILALVSQHVYLVVIANSVGAGVRLMRGAVVLNTGPTDGNGPYELNVSTGGATSQYFCTRHSISYLDSPATTSAVTYKTQSALYSTGGSRAIYCQYNDTGGNANSSITLLEVAG